MKNNKTKQIHIRVTEDYHRQLTDRAKNFDSVSAFIMAAIREFSDTTAQQSLQARKEIGAYYSRIDEHLAHMGGNLNQAMRRINEAANAGFPYMGIMRDQFLPQVEECYRFVTETRKELRFLTTKYVKR